MKGLPSAESAAYSDICEHFEQRMGNPQWKGFPPFAVTVDLIRVSFAYFKLTNYCSGGENTRQ